MTTNDDKPEDDEVRRRFKEALERKQQQHGTGGSNASGSSGPAPHAHGPAKTQRQFRRKSG